MRINYNSITIYIEDTYEDMSKKAARMVAAQVILKPESVVGLATGSTPEGMYKELVNMENEGVVDFSEVTTFNLDEYEDLPPDNLQSYDYYMKKHLFDHIKINMDKVHIPSGTDEDVSKVCREYDQMIMKCGNMDIQILGIGTNGQIGFNEPDLKFEAGTHLVSLDEETIDSNARFFDSIDQVPKKAISMGIRYIMHSKIVVLMANGDK